MKRKALAIVLTLLMLVSVLPMGAFAASYSDTEGHWAETSIDRWTDAKVLEGMGNNLYAPDDFLTRAQAMTIFSRLLKLTEKGDISKLTDVAADAWYAPYIETGYAYEIINGTSETTFDPSGNITREQFFSIFARAVGMNLGVDKASSSNKDFTDLADISDWAKEEGAVYAMINAGYVNGYPDGSLKPLRNITRAEVAKILDNAISDYITENGTYDLTGHNGIVIVTAPNVKLTGDFNGLIVSSCPDSTLDLSSIKGKPHVHILGDNTKIINAPVGTRITISPATDNVTVNNKKYNPRADFIVGASGSSGGTPFNPQTQPTKTAYAFMTFKPLGNVAKNNTLDLRADVYDNSTAQSVLKDLASDANNIGDAVNDILADLSNKHWASKDGKDTVDIVNGEISVTVNGVQKDLVAKLDVASGNFKDAEQRVAKKLTTDSAKAAWDVICTQLDPTNLFDKGVNDKLAIKYKDGEFYAGVISTVLTQLGIIAQNETDLDALLREVYNGSTATYAANSWKADPDAVREVVKITGFVTDPQNANDKINMVVPFNTDSELVNVMLEAGVNGPAQLLSGNYQFTFEIKGLSN
jgi:hypothetical protein